MKPLCMAWDVGASALYVSLSMVIIIQFRRSVQWRPLRCYQRLTQSLQIRHSLRTIFEQSHRLDVLLTASDSSPWLVIEFLTFLLSVVKRW